MNQDTQCSECWSPLNLRTEILISRGMLSGCRILGKWLGHEDQIVTTGSRHLKGVSSRDPKPNKTNDTKSYFQRNHPSLTPQSYFCKVLCSQGLKNLNPRSCARISLCGPSPGLESGLQPPPPQGALVHRQYSSSEILWLALSHRFISLNHCSRILFGLLGCPEYPLELFTHYVPCQVTAIWVSLRVTACTFLSSEQAAPGTYES